MDTNWVGKTHITSPSLSGCNILSGIYIHKHSYLMWDKLYVCTKMKNAIQEMALAWYYVNIAVDIAGNGPL